MTLHDPLAPLSRAASSPNSYDPETRTFEAVAATPTPVVRRDARGPFNEILDPATLTITSGMPLLDSHRTDSVNALLGRVESLRIDGDHVIARARLTSASDADPIAQRIADGSLTGISIGYRVTGWTETTGPDGQRQKSPTGWQITEVTLTTNPADPNARVRHAKAPDDPARSGGIPENRAVIQGNEMENEDTTLDRAEFERRSEIRALGRAAGLTDTATDQLIDRGATVDQAKAVAFDHIHSRTAPVLRTHGPANDDPAVIARRQADALAARMGSVNCPDDARQYMGESLLDMARDSLARSGISTRGMPRDEVLERAAHSTSDFPLVVSNAMHKTAAQAYAAAESPIKKLFRKRVLNNFKTSTSIRLGNIGRLKPMAESGEFTHTTRAENGEPLSLGTFGLTMNVGRNLVIDDDLGQLGDFSSEFGTSAAQTEAELMVTKVTGNPSLSDGTPVFDASRGNIASTGADPNEATLDFARKAMHVVKGLDGKTIIDASPKYLVIGPALETRCEKLLASIYSATTDEVNPFAGKLSLIVEPRIGDASWFLFADPARLPCLQYAYLAGAEGVQIQRSEAWDALGIRFRAWLDFGTGWLDWRGAWFNEGAS